MDTPCHALTGFVAGHAIQSEDESTDRPGVLFMTLVSLIPDADFFLDWFGMSTFLTYHRSLNSVFLLPALLLLFTYTYWWVKPDRSYRSFLLWGGAAVVLHAFMDLWNAFGSPLLFPLSNARFSLDLVFVIDLFVYGFLLIPIAGRLIQKKWSPHLARYSFLLIGLYVLFCGVNQYRARHFVEQFRQEQQIPTSTVIRTGVLPQPLLPTRWSLIIQHENGSEQRFLNTMTGDRYASDEHVPRNPHALHILKEGTSYDRDAAVFDHFSRYPVAKETNNHIIYADLQFHTKLSDRVRSTIVPVNREPNWQTRPVPFRLRGIRSDTDRPTFEWIQTK